MHHVDKRWLKKYVLEQFITDILTWKFINWNYWLKCARCWSRYRWLIISFWYCDRHCLSGSAFVPILRNIWCLGWKGVRDALQNVDKYLRNCGLKLMRCVVANSGVHTQSIPGSYSQSVFDDNTHLRSGDSSFCFSTIYACGRQLSLTCRTIAFSGWQAMMVSPL